MKKCKIYLDTSVISFLYAEDSPEFRDLTIEFFEEQSSLYHLFVSEVVLLEIDKNKNSVLKANMIHSIKKYSITLLDYAEEIDNIAKNYIMNQIIPEKKIEDALHLAYTTFYQIDILLSWNFRHLANINKERKIILENMKMGYHYPIRLLSPLEVHHEE